MPRSMRVSRSVLLLIMVVAALPAHCQQTKQVVREVAIVVKPDATSIVLEVSGDTPYHLQPKTDRLEIDLPKAEWRAKPPQIDRHAGLIESFRRMPVAQGIHLVFTTRAEFTLRDGGPAAVAANGDHIITVIVASPPAAPLVTVTGDGPVVIEGAGYPAPAAKSAPAPVVQQSVECNARMKQEGSVDGKPLVGFADCPATTP